MKKLITMLLITAATLGTATSYAAHQPSLTAPCSAQKTVNLDFTLINKTGYTIEHIYVAPSSQRNWGDNIMTGDVLRNGESGEISFDSQETAKLWDLYVTWLGYDSDEDRYWIGFNLSEIEEITLYYNAETGKTWAKTR